MLPVLKKMGQVTKTIVNSHGSKVKSFILLPGTDQTVLREARGVEVAPLKVKIVIILNVGLDWIGGSFLFRIFVGTFSVHCKSQKVKVTCLIWSSIKEG